jgi:hypothetical protein
MAMKKGEEYGALVVLIMVGVIGGAFGLVGGGLVLVGLGVFLVQCLGWLRYGLWVRWSCGRLGPGLGGNGRYRSNGLGSKKSSSGFSKPPLEFGPNSNWPYCCVQRCTCNRFERGCATLERLSPRWGIEIDI